MPERTLVPAGFEIPAGLQTERLRLRMLTVHDVVKDYDAVMTSAERLRTVFRQNGHWPEGLTLEQNLIELGWHQHEFQLRRSFAYSVVSLDESRVLGCLYIHPTTKGGHDAEISMWVRQSEADSGLDAHLYEAARIWIADEWPFAKPAYPGRTITWDAWEALATD